MKHIYQKIICVIAMFFLLTFSPIVGYANTTEAPKEWNIWLENLIREMKAKGISSSTLDNAYKNKNYYMLYKTNVIFMLYKTEGCREGCRKLGCSSLSQNGYYFINIIIS